MARDQLRSLRMVSLRDMKKSVWVAALVIATLSSACAPSLLAREDTVRFVNHSSANLPDGQRLVGAVTDENGAVVTQGEFFQAQDGSSGVDPEDLDVDAGTYRAIAMAVACESDCEDEIPDAVSYSGAQSPGGRPGAPAVAVCDEMFSLHGHGSQHVFLVLREVDVERRSCRLDVEIGEE